MAEVNPKRGKRPKALRIDEQGNAPSIGTANPATVTITETR